MSVSWEIDLRGIPAPFEALVRKLTREFVRAKVPSSIPQAKNDGAQSFFFTIPAADPCLPRSSAPLGQHQLQPGGMTIGGPVIPAPMGSTKTVYIKVGRFNRPEWWGHCREQARGGDGSDCTRNALLGRPLITRGEDGRVTNVLVYFIKEDCPKLSGAWLKLVLAEQLTVADFRPPPFEDPNWKKTLGVELGLNSQLVTITGLDRVKWSHCAAPASGLGIKSILIRVIRKQVLASAGLPSSNACSILLQRLPIDGYTY